MGQELAHQCSTLPCPSAGWSKSLRSRHRVLQVIWYSFSLVTSFCLVQFLLLRLIRSLLLVFQALAPGGSSVVRPLLSTMCCPTQARCSFQPPARRSSAIWMGCVRPWHGYDRLLRSLFDFGNGAQLCCAPAGARRQAGTCGSAFPESASQASSQQSCTVSSQWNCNGLGWWGCSG